MTSPSTNKYAASHHSPNGPGDARPTAMQIVEDEGLIGKLSDKVVLVTGTSSGIGVPTVEAMAATGATVFASARDTKKNEDALKGIKGKIELIEMDLSSFESVRKGAKDFLERSGEKLNILINNAGVMAVKERTLTKDGHEMQFGTNHLAHFLLFQLLKPALLSAATPEFPSRVINLSSSGHRASSVHFDNLSLDNGEYSPWVGYGQSKTANIWMTNAITRKYADKNLYGLALHPGGIMTPLQRHLDKEMVDGWMNNKELVKGIKSPEQGAATTVLAALGKDYKGKGGLFLEDAGEWGPQDPKDKGNLGSRGYAKWAFDKEGEEKLWTESNKIVGEQD